MEAKHKTKQKQKENVIPIIKKPNSSSSSDVEDLSDFEDAPPIVDSE